MASELRFLTVGDLEIVSLPDAIGTFGTYEELFPSTVESVWDPWRMKLPELFKGEAWMVPFGAFLARGSQATVLIDTGLGPPPGEEDFMHVRQGWLPQSLEAAGVAPDDVNIVFSTHHHSDHIGWNVKAGRPLFPHARYVNGAAAWDWTLSNRTEDWILAQLTPLLEAGVADLVENGAEIAPGITAIATPGHYPGHMSVLIDSGGQRAIVLADVAVHPAQISNPEIAYAFDVDPHEATETRRSFFARLRRTECAVLCSHYPRGGIGRLVGDGESMYWEPNEASRPEGE